MNVNSFASSLNETVEVAYLKGILRETTLL